MGQMQQTVHRILVADRRDHFSSSVCGALRDEGYACEHVPDAISYMNGLRQARCGLAIVGSQILTDARKSAPTEHDELASGVPIILVSGELGSNGPIDLTRLRVISLVERSIALNTLVDCVRSGIEESGAASKGMPNSHYAGVSSLSVGALLDLTCQEITNSLSNLNQLAQTALAGQESAAKTEEACHLFRCPRLLALNASIAEAVDVLERTKNSFKSKELADLRRKLEALLREAAVRQAM
jgi:DNA-binding NtrC family response regulator